MVLKEEEIKIFSAVEEKVCEYFGVSVEMVIKKDTTNEVSMVRNMLYYILHHEFGMSVSKIAKRYKRMERGVKAQLAKERFCIENNRAYAQIHGCMIERIKKSGML